MPGPSESLVALDQRLAERPLAFETMDAAWPKGRTAIERAEIGREHEEALYEIASLRTRIATGRADTPADAAVQRGHGGRRAPVARLDGTYGREIYDALLRDLEHLAGEARS